MCGIAGFFDLNASLDEASGHAAARAMGDAIASRGPDGEGVWVDAPAGVGLAHRRLAIIELSPAGDQPMTSRSGRMVIVYNGEVFNFEELRRDLSAAGVRFRGRSDTEVLLEACESWGIEKTLERLIGMFAFALWNRQDRRLTLVRDRLGIKPLFWGRRRGVVLFGSQPKALSGHPLWSAEVDPAAAAQFLRFNYVPAPMSIWKDVEKLEPGHLLSIDRDGGMSKRRWWDLREVARAGAACPLDVTDAEAADMVDELARDAVGRRLVSDVPLGAFLSGGIDSSLVVALMQRQSARPVKTFTIGFAQKEFDEAPYAKAVAAHLGADHTEFYVGEDSLLDLVPRLSEPFDEPFADPSELPTLLLAGLARRSVTVALAGDGGDEVFSGYTRYRLAESLVRCLGPVPPAARAAAGAVLRRLPCRLIDAPFRFFRRAPLVGDRMHKLAGLLDFRTADDLYAGLVTIWDDACDLVPASKTTSVTPLPFDDRSALATVSDFSRRMQITDCLTYLPDWVLAKTDRATMAVGLEARVPLLDHRLVELSCRLPSAFMSREGEGKWLLRRVLERYVPCRLFDRPKRGFEPPVGLWLRGPLREWAQDLLSERSLAQDGLLDPKPILKRLQEHLSGTRNWQYQLWGVLMLQSWRQRWT
jgi:asparagine synthase (glutamine-hydrolysing)